MRKIFLVLLLTIALSSGTSVYSAQDNSGAWTVGTLLVGFLAGTCYGFLVGDTEQIGGFWGTQDSHTLHIGPIFNSCWIDSSNKAADTGLGVIGGYRFMMHSKNKWFDVVRNGWEADADVVATFNSEKGVSFMNGGTAFGPNFALFELGDKLRVTCGLGYMWGLFFVNAFYVRPGIDFRLTDFLTINVMYFNTLFAGYGDPTTSNFVYCTERRLEVGVSLLGGNGSNPSAVSLRYRFGQQIRQNTQNTGDAGGGTLQYHGVILAYTLPI